MTLICVQRYQHSINSEQLYHWMFPLFLLEKRCMQSEIFLMIKYHTFCRCISTLAKGKIWYLTTSTACESWLIYPLTKVMIHIPINQSTVNDDTLIAELLFYHFYVNKKLFFVSYLGERYSAIMTLLLFECCILKMILTVIVSSRP